MMHFVLVFILVCTSLSIAASLEERQPYPCYQDRCLRAVNGTRHGPNHPIIASSDCRNHLTTTVVFDPIFTTTIVTSSSIVTVSPSCITVPASTSEHFLRTQVQSPNGELEARQATTSPIGTTTAPIPTYATRQCVDEHYSSACRCLGIRPGRATSTGITVTETKTSTVVDTSTVSCSLLVPSNSTRGPATSTTYTITMSYGTTTSTTTVVISQPGYPTGTESGTGTESLPYPSWTGSHPYPTGTSHSETSCPETPSPTTSRSLISSSSSSTIFTPTPPYTNSTTTISPIDTSSPFLPTNTTSPPPSASFPSPPYTNSNTTLPPTATSSSVPSTILPTNSTTTSTPIPTPPICGGRGVLSCSGTCIDSTTDTQHCGRCNNQCGPNFLCTNGVCTRTACDSDCTFSRLCGNNNDTITCACGLDTGNAGVCYNRQIDCGVGGPPRCFRTSQCEVGSVCVPTACCDGGRCVRPDGCGDTGGLGALGKRARFGRADSRVVVLGFE